ncbi:MAG: long-chain fatty acid--CoA ligase [Bdellovibrionales bacterium]|nr:fatty acid--CoA ligase family protein [Bdellovibrionales bacterium]NQZ19992.1 long-chain fatty acid--CoA ligase [Bdellovibrionales bacterium]
MSSIYSLISDLEKNQSLIRFEDQSITYEELLHRIQTTIIKLKPLPSGSLCYYRTINPIETLIHLVACFESGLHFLPFFEGGSLMEDQRNCEKLKVHFAIDEAGNISEKFPDSPVLEEPGGVIFQSSGSTGPSKFIYQSQENLIKNAALSAEYQGIDQNSSILNHLTLSHTGGLNMQTLPALLKGACLHFLKSPDLNKLASLFSNKFSHTILVPYVFRRLLRSKYWDVSQLNKNLLILTGSCPVDHQMIKKSINEKLRILSVYGLTEIGPFTCVWDSQSSEIKSLERKESILGQPLQDYKFTITNEDELTIEGPCQGSYLQTSDNERFVTRSKNGIATGDLVFKENNNYYFKGRKNRIINRAGFKINPEEIETLIKRLSDVKDCHVYAVTDPEFYQVPHCDIVADGSLSVYDLKTYLKQHIHNHKFPRKWNFVDQIDHTSIEKTKRKVHQDD